MNKDDTMDKVRLAFKEALNVDVESITINSTPDDITGWDSLGHVLLGASLEEIFDTSLDVDELMEMEDVNSIVKIMLGKVS